MLASARERRRAGVKGGRRGEPHRRKALGLITQGDCVVYVGYQRLVGGRGEGGGRGETGRPRSCSLVYKTFRKLFLVRCDSMHSIVKACLLTRATVPGSGSPPASVPPPPLSLSLSLSLSFLLPPLPRLFYLRTQRCPPNNPGGCSHQRFTILFPPPSTLPPLLSFRRSSAPSVCISN